MMTIPEQLKKRYNKSHLSYSSIKQALGDMAQFDRYMKGELLYKSDALDFGTLYDMLLFERAKAMDTYFVVNKQKILNECSEKTKHSKSPHLTNEYKAAKQEIEDQAKMKGQTLVSHEDWQMANDMIDRLSTCGLLDTYLAGDYQVGFLEELNGVQVKGFLDCLGDGFISDSKSARSAEKFRYAVRDFCYDIQAYIYTKVFGIKDFYWVVQEKTYPYLPALVKCTDETIFVGEMKYNEAVNRIRVFLNDDYEPTKDYLQYEV
tara:strand:- start:4634 stop:5419 length:786 start_codon:yes stop_codon:yes gene_type:complete